MTANTIQNLHDLIRKALKRIKTDAANDKFWLDARRDQVSRLQQQKRVMLAALSVCLEADTCKLDAMAEEQVRAAIEIGTV